MDRDSCLGAYVKCTASLLIWIKKCEWLHSRGKTVIVIKLISLRNVCLSPFKIPSIYSSLKRQHLRAKLLKNHFILTAKVHVIMQWEKCFNAWCKNNIHKSSVSLSTINHTGTFMPSVQLILDVFQVTMFIRKNIFP